MTSSNDRPNIDFDLVPFDRLTIPQIREEIQNQGGTIVGRPRKADLIRSLVNHLQRLHQPNPYTEPVALLIDRFLTGRPIGRVHHPVPRRAPRIQVPPPPSEIDYIQDINSSQGIPADLDINPYLLLNNAILDEIMDERDVDIGRSMHVPFVERALRLHELDNILPAWKLRLQNVHLQQLRSLTRPQLYVYAAMRNISLTSFLSYADNLDNLRDILRILLLCPDIGSTPDPLSITTDPNRDIRSLEQLLAVTRQRTFPTRICRSHLVVHFLTNLDISEADVVVRRLAEYPLTISTYEYALIRRTNQTILRKILEYRKVPRETAIFLSPEECIFTVSRKFLPPLNPRLEAIQLRYNTILTYTPEIRDILQRLYRVQDEDPVAGIAKCDPVPLESIIILMQTYPIPLLAKHVGMAIPPHADANLYFQNNILHYASVLSRPTDVSFCSREKFITMRDDEVSSYCKLLTDEELFRLSEVYINYASRSDLLTNLQNLRTREGFFIPLIRRCQNKHTQLYSDTTDTNIFIIGFGTLGSYIGYEIDELLHSFHYIDTDSISGDESDTRQRNGRNRGDFIFRHPENIRSIFTINQIEQLRQLLLAWVGDYPTLQPLIDRIDEGLVDIRQKTDYDKQLLRDFRRLSKDQQNLIRSYLYDLFYAGMYMRRWEGPGHPYPHRTAQTENTKISPDANTLKSLKTLESRIDTFAPQTKTLICGTYTSTRDNFTGGLRVVEYFGADPQQQRNFISNLLYEVMKGEYCIRMASSRFVGTGVYYLRLLYNENIPDFDPTTLDRIY